MPNKKISKLSERPNVYPKKAPKCVRTSKRLPDHEKSQEKNTSLFSKSNSRETNIAAVMEEEAPQDTQSDASSQEGSPEDDDFVE